MARHAGPRREFKQDRPLAVTTYTGRGLRGLTPLIATTRWKRTETSATSTRLTIRAELQRLKLLLGALAYLSVLNVG
jgi:hypothetical protein